MSSSGSPEVYICYRSTNLFGPRLHRDLLDVGFTVHGFALCGQGKLAALEAGLRRAAYFIIVFDRPFFSDNASKEALDGVFNSYIKTHDQKTILPILFATPKTLLQEYSPLIATFKPLDVKSDCEGESFRTVEQFYRRVRNDQRSLPCSENVWQWDRVEDQVKVQIGDCCKVRRLQLVSRDGQFSTVAVIDEGCSGCPSFQAGDRLAETSEGEQSCVLKAGSSVAVRKCQRRPDFVAQNLCKRDEVERDASLGKSISRPKADATQVFVCFSSDVDGGNVSWGLRFARMVMDLGFECHLLEGGNVMDIRPLRRKLDDSLHSSQYFVTIFSPNPSRSWFDQDQLNAMFNAVISSDVEKKILPVARGGLDWNAFSSESNVFGSRSALDANECEGDSSIRTAAQLLYFRVKDDKLPLSTSQDVWEWSYKTDICKCEGLYLTEVQTVVLREQKPEFEVVLVAGRPGESFPITRCPQPGARLEHIEGFTGKLKSAQEACEYIQSKQGQVKLLWTTVKRKPVYWDWILSSKQIEILCPKANRLQCPEAASVSELLPEPCGHKENLQGGINQIATPLYETPGVIQGPEETVLRNDTRPPGTAVLDRLVVADENQETSTELLPTSCFDSMWHPCAVEVECKLTDEGKLGIDVQCVGSEDSSHKAGPKCVICVWSVHSTARCDFRQGDRLVSANGESMEGLDSTETAKILGKHMGGGASLKLAVRRVRDVEVLKNYVGVDGLPNKETQVSPLPQTSIELPRVTTDILAGQKLEESHQSLPESLQNGVGASTYKKEAVACLEDVVVLPTECEKLSRSSSPYAGESVGCTPAFQLRSPLNAGTQPEVSQGKLAAVQPEHTSGLEREADDGLKETSHPIKTKQKTKAKQDGVSSRDLASEQEIRFNLIWKEHVDTENYRKTGDLLGADVVNVQGLGGQLALVVSTVDSETVLRRGDRLVSICGQTLDGLECAEAKRVIKDAGKGSVSIAFRRIGNMERLMEYATRQGVACLTSAATNATDLLSVACSGDHERTKTKDVSRDGDIGCRSDTHTKERKGSATFESPFDSFWEKEPRSSCLQEERKNEVEFFDITDPDTHAGIVVVSKVSPNVSMNVGDRVSWVDDRLDNFDSTSVRGIIAENKNDVIIGLRMAKSDHVEKIRLLLEETNGTATTTGDDGNQSSSTDLPASSNLLSGRDTADVLESGREQLHLLRTCTQEGQDVGSLSTDSRQLGMDSLDVDKSEDMNGCGQYVSSHLATGHTTGVGPEDMVKHEKEAGGLKFKFKKELPPFLLTGLADTQQFQVVSCLNYRDLYETHPFDSPLMPYFPETKLRRGTDTALASLMAQVDDVKKDQKKISDALSDQDGRMIERLNNLTERLRQDGHKNVATLLKDVVPQQTKDIVKRIQDGQLKSDASLIKELHVCTQKLLDDLSKVVEVDLPNGWRNELSATLDKAVDTCVTSKKELESLVEQYNETAATTKGLVQSLRDEVRSCQDHMADGLRREGREDMIGVLRQCLPLQLEVAAQCRQAEGLTDLAKEMRDIARVEREAMIVALETKLPQQTEEILQHVSQTQQQTVERLSEKVERENHHLADSLKRERKEDFRTVLRDEFPHWADEMRRMVKEEVDIRAKEMEGRFTEQIHGWERRTSGQLTVMEDDIKQLLETRIQMANRTPTDGSWDRLNIHIQKMEQFMCEAKEERETIAMSLETLQSTQTKSSQETNELQSISERQVDILKQMERHHALLRALRSRDTHVVYNIANSQYVVAGADGQIIVNSPRSDAANLDVDDSETAAKCYNTDTDDSDNGTPV